MHDIDVPSGDQDPILIPLLLITPAVAFMVTLPLSFRGAFGAVLVALAGAGAIGAPALSTARRFGLRGFVPTALLGLLAGAASLGAAIVTYEVVRRQPLLTTIDVEYVGVAAIIGAATGAIYSTVHDAFNLPPGGAKRRVLYILLVAVVVPYIAITAFGTLSRPAGTP